MQCFINADRRWTYVYSWNSGAHAGTLAVTTCGLTSEDTILMLFRATVATSNPAIAADWVCIDFSDDSCSRGGSQSTVLFTADPGQAYFIAVAHYNPVFPRGYDGALRIVT